MLLAIFTTLLADPEPVRISRSRADYYSAQATYLRYSHHPIGQAMNATLASLAKKRVDAWVKEADRTAKDLGRPTHPWELELGFDVTYQTKTLVSVAVSEYNYSGGAHPNHGMETISFGIVSGKPKRLKLADLFNRGFDAYRHTNALLMAKLRKIEGADWIKNGDLKKLTPTMLERWTPTKKGLVWHMNPYDVGPYAAGDFDVSLSIAELGMNFRKELLSP